MSRSQPLLPLATAATLDPRQSLHLLSGLLPSLPPSVTLHTAARGIVLNLSQILSLPCSKPSTELPSQSKSLCKPRSLRPIPLVLTPFLTSPLLHSALAPGPFPFLDLCPLSPQGRLPWSLCENAKCPLQTPPATCPCFIVSHQLSAPPNMPHMYIFIFYIICLPPLLSTSKGLGLAPVLETGPGT